MLGIILITFIFFIIIKTAKNNSAKKVRKEDEIFWEREKQANETRKVNIDNLPYITLHEGQLPLHKELNDTKSQDYINDIEALYEKEILNCTGMSNTDLKLKYGAANITRLAECDQNFTVLVRSLARLAERYLDCSRESKQDEDLSDLFEGTAFADTGISENKHNENPSALNETLAKDAQKLLEYSIIIGSDVKLAYELLSSLYIKNGEEGAIKRLILSASMLNSLNKEPILRYLQNLNR